MLWRLRRSERNFDSDGVEVGNSVKSGNGVDFSTKLWYNIIKSLAFGRTL